MKKVASVITGIVLVLVLLLVAMWIHLERTEWTLRSETENVAIPLKMTNQTLTEIEEQTRQEAVKRYSDAYLHEITWVASTNDGFENCTDGELRIIYCDNLGNANGFYKYDRYAFCAVSVDMQKREITKVETYGNSRLAGNSKFEVYPEFSEIRDAIHRYCAETKPLPKGYAIESCYVVVRNGGISTANFSVRLPNGAKTKIEGKMQGLFAAQDGVSYLLFVENMQ